MTPEVIAKLEEAFLYGLSDRKATVFANISMDALYDYCNRYPEFGERKEALKLNPDIIAQKTVALSLGDPAHAWRWLEKKEPDFMPKSKIEHGGAVELTDTVTEMSSDEKEALSVLRAARRKRLEQQIKSRT